METNQENEKVASDQANSKVAMKETITLHMNCTTSSHK